MATVLPFITQDSANDLLEPQRRLYPNYLGYIPEIWGNSGVTPNFWGKSQKFGVMFFCPKTKLFWGGKSGVTPEIWGKSGVTPKYSGNLGFFWGNPRFAPEIWVEIYKGQRSLLRFLGTNLKHTKKQSEEHLQSGVVNWLPFYKHIYII